MVVVRYVPMLWRGQGRGGDTAGLTKSIWTLKDLLLASTSMNLSEANELWYELKPINGVMFCYNDYVRIKSGQYAGNGASVISLVALEPVTYLVELDAATGGDVVIAESDLEEVL